MARAMVNGGEPMQCRITDLRYKEIINISDGARFGYVWGRGS
jgi:hypothetical protein